MNISKSSFSIVKQCFSITKKVLLFGGQGTHEKGMFQKYLQKPEQKRIIEQQSNKLNIDLLQIGTTDHLNLLNQTQYTQPLLVLSHFLQYHYNEKHKPLLQQINKNKSQTYCIGHSLGQYSALLISQSISLSQCLKLVHMRGLLMSSCSQPGQKYGTLIIKYKLCHIKQIQQIIQQQFNLQISCYNSPTNILVSGSLTKLTQLSLKLKHDLKIGSMKLPVSTAFHCRLLDKMKYKYKQILDKILFNRPVFKILRNIDCKIYENNNNNENNNNDIKYGLLEQNTRPVEFMKAVEYLMRKEGNQMVQFIDIGHKEHLIKWVNQIRKDNQ